MKGARFVVVGSERWGYRVGDKNVVIVAPDGKKTIVDIDVFADRAARTAEQGRGGPDESGEWITGTSDGMITPAIVRKYIETHRNDTIGKETP